LTDAFFRLKNHKNAGGKENRDEREREGMDLYTEKIK